MTDLRHNNNHIYLVWWPAFGILLFIQIVLMFALRIVERAMKFMEIDE
jgi:hypothetical protein